jgi:LCP family protein required for cell wall assembly
VNKKRILTFIFAILGLFLLVAGIGLASNWNNPLGQGLDLPTLTATPLKPSATPAPVQPGEPTATPAPLATATPAPMCGGPAEPLYILAIGSDTRRDNYLYGLSDVMRIMRVDFIAGKVTVVDMPRDIWVEIPGISDHYDITHGKLNQAYLYGNPGMGYYDGPGEGPGLLARVLLLNFGIRADNYVAVNMQTFVRIVDALGGIDVYLPEDVDGRPIDDKTEDMGYFYAGQQHLDGEHALKLARVRKKYSTFKRASNQNIVLCAIKEKAFSAEVLPRVPQIIASFQNNVQTDLSPEQITQLACLAPKLQGDNLIMTNMPEELFTSDRQYDDVAKTTRFVLRADFEKVRDLIAQFQAGTWPTPDPESGPSCVDYSVLSTPTK